MVNESSHKQRFPPRERNRNYAVLLVTQNTQTAEDIGNRLESEGYAVKAVRTPTDGINTAKISFLEAVVLDVEGNVPNVPRQEDTVPKANASTFLDELRRFNPDLSVILINSGNNADYFTPTLVDLSRREGVVVKDGMPIEISPTSDASAEPPGYKQLATNLQKAGEEILAKRRGRFSEVAEDLSRLVGTDSGLFSQLKIATGTGVRDTFTRDRNGGKAFLGEESIGGVTASIDPTRTYPPTAVGLHTKIVPEGVSARTRQTYEFLTKRNPFKIQRIPMPIGFHEEGGLEYLVQTFIIATNLSDAHAALFDKLQAASEAEKTGAEALWRAITKHFIIAELPTWYKDTHDVVMQDTHKQARERLRTDQINQILYLPQKTEHVSGRPMPAEAFEDVRRAVYELYDRLGPIDERLFVLPMDPKGANLGLLTHQTRVSRERLLELFPPPYSNLAAAFSHWDFKPLGTVTPFLVDLFQFLLDPRLQFPEEKQPQGISQALEAVLRNFPQGANPAEFLNEIYRQGAYKAAFKVYVTLAHAQQNEGRLLTMRNLDYETAVAKRSRLQQDANYFLLQALKFFSGLYRANIEGHAQLGWDRAAEAMTEHFTNPDRWVRLENGQRGTLPSSIRRVHNVLNMIRTEGLAEFDPNILRNNYGTQRELKY